jgi:quinol monooxygenase YgiN
MFGMLGRLTAHPGRGDELEAILLEAAEALNADHDCLLYVVQRPDDEPDSVWVTEAWTTEEAHRASLDRDETRALIKRAGPLLAGPPSPVRVRPVGGKGLAGIE